MPKLKSKKNHKKEELLTSYNLQLSIDTFILVGKLSKEQIEKMCDYFYLQKKNWYQDRYFHYNIHIGNIIIKYSPRNPFAWNNYNTMIVITRNASNTHIPHSLKEILKFNTWKSKRIDLAFDFSNNTPFSTFPNRLIMKHHGNVSFLQLNQNDKEWNTEYLGTLNSRTEVKACCYDRNEKEVDRGTGIEHEYPLRFEVRLFPKLNEFNNLNRIDHGWIENKLSKYIFIPDIEALPLNKWDKRKLFKVQENYNYWREIQPQKQKEIKRVVNSLRVPFDDIYCSHKETLFSFLDIPLFQLDIPNQFTEQLTFQELF
jgi:hypothetical protein